MREYVILTIHHENNTTDSHGQRSQTEIESLCFVHCWLISFHSFLELVVVHGFSYLKANCHHLRDGSSHGANGCC